MSVYNPPEEFPIIFDSNLFPDTTATMSSSSSSTNNYVNYPTAQGRVTFPNGITTNRVALRNAGVDNGYIGQTIYPTISATFPQNNTAILTCPQTFSIPNAGVWLISGDLVFSSPALVGLQDESMELYTAGVSFIPSQGTTTSPYFFEVGDNQRRYVQSGPLQFRYTLSKVLVFNNTTSTYPFSYSIKVFEYLNRNYVNFTTSISLVQLA